MVRKDHLGTQMCIESLLVSKLSFQLNTKKMHFVEVITKAKNLLRKYNQAEKLRNCVYIFYFMFTI